MNLEPNQKQSIRIHDIIKPLKSEDNAEERTLTMHTERFNRGRSIKTTTECLRLYAEPKGARDMRAGMSDRSSKLFYRFIKQKLLCKD